MPRSLYCLALVLFLVACHQSPEKMVNASGKTTTAALGSDSRKNNQAALPPEDLQEVLIRNPPGLDSFYLHDHLGAPFTLERLKGKWNFLVFGYTNCPDICPTTLAEMDDFKALMPEGKLKNDTQVLFVTLDPKRDTKSELKQYLGYFNKGFLGITGSVEDIHRFCTPLDIEFSYEKLSKEVYGVNHSSAVVLIDPELRYFARFNVPIYAEELFKQYKKIIDYQKTL